MPSRPEPPEHSEEAEFLGPDDDSWYRTQIPDWIALCPQVNHTAYRLYVIIRSLILEKQPKKVRLLSHEQLAFLLPGPNGKPSGVRTIKDALQTLTEIGLISNPDGARIVTSSGKGTINTRRRYQLHDWPTAELAMKVWRNAFDKLDAFTPDWRETRTDVFAGEIVGRNSAPRQDTPQDDVSAGQIVGRNSAEPGRDSARRRRNSARHADATSADATSLKQFPQGVSSSSGAADTAPAPRTPVDEDEDTVVNEQQQPRPRAVDLVREMTDATEDEAVDVLARIRADYKAHHGRDVRSIRRYVSGFDVEDLTPHLKAVRAQRASESRAEATGPDAVCSKHREALDCPVCATSAPAVVVGLLRDQGPARRPDLAALVRTRPDLVARSRAAATA